MFSYFWQNTDFHMRVRKLLLFIFSWEKRNKLTFSLLACFKNDIMIPPPPRILNLVFRGHEDTMHIFCTFQKQAKFENISPQS